MSTNNQGFDTIATHGGYEPDPTTQLGLGQGAPTGIAIYRTTPYKFKNTKHAANLFKLKELGNIYSRLVSRILCMSFILIEPLFLPMWFNLQMNPTCNILESRYAQLEGGHPLSGLAVSSGMTAIFYSIVNLASKGDNIVAAKSLYGGTYTLFNNELPRYGIEGEFSWYCEVFMLAKRINA